MQDQHRKAVRSLASRSKLHCPSPPAPLPGVPGRGELEIQIMKTSFITALVSLIGLVFESQANDDRYFIDLRPVAAVGPQVVRLGDVADITGPDDVVIAALQGIDLQDPPQLGETISITKTQVDLRLKLAKAPAGRIVVRGDKTIIGLSRSKAAEQPAKVARLADSKTTHTVKQVSAIRPTSKTEVVESHKVATQSSRQRVVTVAKQVILNRLPWDPNDIEIDATHVGNRADDLSPEQLDNLHAELRSAWPPLGRVQIVVNAPGQGVGEFGIPVVLNVKYFQDTVVAKRALEMGRPIQAEDVYVDRREIRELGMNMQSINDVVGRVAIRPITALQPVRVGDLKNNALPAAPAPAKPVVIDRTPAIRRGDTVQLVAQGGPIAISIMAKAQQDGQVGETIRLENVDSKKIVTGKVVGKNQVEVVY